MRGPGNGLRWMVTADDQLIGGQRGQIQADVKLRCGPTGNLRLFCVYLFTMSKTHWDTLSTTPI